MLGLPRTAFFQLFDEELVANAASGGRLGLTLSTKTHFGASAVIAVAFTISELTGLKLGDATFYFYSLFIIAQIILHLLPGKELLLTEKEH